MIIILNGGMNSGKSTISKVLAERLTQTAIVEIDALREFVECLSLQESIPINIQNAADITRRYVDNGLNVVVCYPFSPKNFELFVATLKSPSKIEMIHLKPRLDIALTNRGSRELDAEEQDRIRHHHTISTIYSHDHGLTVDNSTQSVDETVKQIIDYIVP